MIQKRYNWTNGAISTQNESVWENTFTIKRRCVAVRFDVTAYGWKASAGTENMDEIIPGRYKVYSKKSSESSYTLRQVMICERADTSSTNVYVARQIDLDDGLTDDETIDIKIEARDATNFAARTSGTIEGITSGSQFWSNLKIKIPKYFISDLSETGSGADSINVVKL